MNRPTRLLQFLCFAVVPLVWAAVLDACHGQELVVADSGGSEYRIVVATQPTLEESSAASELQKYLKQATGAELPVVKNDALPEGKCLVVGRRDTELVNSVLATSEAPKLKDHDEAFLVATVGDDIVLTGRAPHAVLYAVYDFLEDPVGCAWLFPDDLGEHVPEVQTLKVGKLRRSEAPSMPFRWIGSREWALRNKMNMNVQTSEKKDRTGVEQLLGGHSFRKLLHPDEYFDAHPEYYALVAGRRKRSENVYGDQYCTSNPEVVRVVVENMRKRLDEKPLARIISLSPNDGYGFCECDQCMALDDPGPFTIKDLQAGRNVPFEHRKGLLSRRMLLFNNAVARELAKTHPDVMIKCFAYSCYAAPPKDPDLRAEPNLLVQLCHSLCHNHILADPNCHYNVGYSNYLDGWGRISRHLAIYEYYWKFAWLDLPWPILHSMRHDIPQYHQAGAKLLYTQHARGNSAGGFGPIYYIAARLSWDVDADVDALLARFCDKAYAGAGDTMRRYYMLWEDAIQASDIHAVENMPEACLKVFTPANLATASKLLAEASELAETPKARLRVQAVATQLEYARLASRYIHTLQAIRVRHPANWTLEGDAATNQEIKQQATPVIADIRALFEANQDTRVIRYRNNYIEAFLNPRRAMSLVDSIGSEDDADPLTADTWLKRPAATEVARRPGLPERIDLWVYGHDFDSDRDSSEHDLFVVSADGRRRLVAKLAPSGENGGSQVRCYVVRGIDTRDLDGATVRLVLINHPGGWTGSTVLAYYVMPHLPRLTNEQATAMVRQHRDRVRAVSAGFLEYPRRGLKNGDGAEEEITIPVIGLPEQGPPPDFVICQ